MSIKRDVLKCVLKDIGKSSYPVLEKFVPLLQNQTNSEYLHNDQQLKIDDPSMKNWEGNGSSIPISFLNLNVFKNKKENLYKPMKIFLSILSIQIIFGISTLVSGLNIYLASIHQILGVLLVLSGINLYYFNAK